MSSPAAIAAVASLFCFAVFLVLEVLGNHFSRGGTVWLLRNAATCLMLLLISLLIFVPSVAGGWGMLLALTFGGLAFACGFVLYAPFLYTVRTSLSVQSLVVLLEHGGQLRRPLLVGRFTSEDLVRRRLVALTESGYLTVQDGRFVPTRRGKAVATIFAAIKACWRLGPGG